MTQDFNKTCAEVMKLIHSRSDDPTDFGVVVTSVAAEYFAKMCIASRMTKLEARDAMDRVMHRALEKCWEPILRDFDLMLVTAVQLRGEKK